jgi:succinate dehydrogenase / fumarate reductase cytochrome b subunit
MPSTEIPGESKAYPGHSPEPPKKRVMDGWFAPWKRSLGTWGFALNRVAGLGLVVYLFLHLIILSLLLRGPESWDTFIALAKSPAFLVLDIVLIAGIVGHGLNGLRVALVGTGLLVRWQRSLFLVLIVVMLVLFAIGSVLVFVM